MMMATAEQVKPALWEANWRAVVTVRKCGVFAATLLMIFAYFPAPSLQAQWTATTVVSAGDVGRFSSSLVVVNGNPAISYCDYTGSTEVLKFVRATDALGSAWGAPVTVDSSGSVGFYSSMVIVNGNPAISYFDTASADLKYVRATNASGTAWGTPVTVDATGDVGYESSLLVVNGNPAIGYFDETLDDLKFVRAADVSGSSWGTPVSADPSSVGVHTSMAIVNGNPAIAYFDESADDLKYVRATDPSGTAWDTPFNFNKGGYDDISLVVVTGNPAIAYIDSTIIGTTELAYYRATDASGTTWGPQIIVSTPGFSHFCSMAIVYGNPAIAFCATGNNDIKFVRATNALGTAWGAVVEVDAAGWVGIDYTTLAVVNGNPAISYGEFTNHNLKYAYFIPTPSPTPPPNFALDWAEYQ